MNLVCFKKLNLKGPQLLVDKNDLTAKEANANESNKKKRSVFVRMCKNRIRSHKSLKSHIPTPGRFSLIV
jgi:hypothetical protein